MKKGFTLIELLLYISLLSILFLGIFSYLFNYLYSKGNMVEIDDKYYQLLIKNYHVK